MQPRVRQDQIRRAVPVERISPDDDRARRAALVRARVRACAVAVTCPAPPLAPKAVVAVRGRRHDPSIRPPGPSTLGVAGCRDMLDCRVIPSTACTPAPARSTTGAQRRRAQLGARRRRSPAAGAARPRAMRAARAPAPKATPPISERGGTMEAHADPPRRVERRALQRGGAGGRSAVSRVELARDLRTGLTVVVRLIVGRRGSTRSRAARIPRIAGTPRDSSLDDSAPPCAGPAPVEPVTVRRSPAATSRFGESVASPTD